VNRVERSVLAVPASSWKMIEKGASSNADLVFLDLQDAVAPGARAAARTNVARAFQELNWGAKPRVFRINDVRSPECHRDLLGVLTDAGRNVDIIIVPKVDSVADVHFVDLFLNQIECAIGRASGSIGIEVQIESAAGLANCDAIAGASPRIEALVFGPGDFAASVGMPVGAIGVPNEWDAGFPGLRLQYALSRILIAARANGLRAIDGPYADFRDPDGLRASTRIARGLGLDGKWCIHPAQIEIVNEVFTPTGAELDAARAVIAAYETAIASGKGSARIAGAMIDAASLRMAQRTLGLEHE
jgi:citrate lyase beta subunit